jgi:predicted nucleotidyltransferase
MRHETVMKIINLMRNDLGEGFTILEISKKLKIGYRPAYNHISELNERDIILIKKVGHSKQCFINLESEKAKLLLQESDIIKKEKLFQKNKRIKNILEELNNKITIEIPNKLHSIILFGSYAKGTFKKSSDVDLLFIVSNIEDKFVRENIQRECSAYQYSHNIEINPIISDIVQFRKMIESKGLNVGKEAKEFGIVLYGIEQFWRQIS